MSDKGQEPGEAQEIVDALPADPDAPGNAPDGEEGTHPTFDLPKNHPLLKELAKVRREAAASRVKNNETEEAAKKWKEHVESQKSEMERLADAKAQLEKELSSLKTAQLRREIAKEFNIDNDELLDLIDAGDEETMRLKAEKLAKGLSKPSTAVDLHAGTRGRPVAGKGLTGGELLFKLSKGESF